MPTRATATSLVQVLRRDARGMQPRRCDVSCGSPATRSRCDGCCRASRSRTRSAPAAHRSATCMGFKDGTANPDRVTSRDDGRARVGQRERRRTHRGRSTAPTWSPERIRMRVEFWDRTALHTQEAIIGRLKDTGAPLDGVYERPTCPRYASDADGASTPLTAHIRLANPRTARPRRTASFVVVSTSPRGSRPTGSSTKGLLFVCFQRSLADGFLAVQEPAQRRGPRGVHQAGRRRLLLRAAGCHVSATATSARRLLVVACTVMSDSRQPGGTSVRRSVG